MPSNVVRRRPLRWVAVALAAAVASASACAPIGPSASESVSPVAVPKSAPATPPPDTSSMRLVLGEEFNGSELDERYWKPELAWGHVNGEELQYYDPKALALEDGMLTITARKEQAEEGKQYTSGVICSSERFQFKYGYVEMRARVPKGQGLWPSFWMLSSRDKDPTEIDIAEFIGGNPYQVQTTLHWAMGSGNKHTSIYTGPDYSAGFHTYAMDWQPDRIVWYVDGVERFRVTDHIPDMPMYLITNLSVGGRYPGPPDSTTPAEAAYRIDYIRVYARD